MIVTRYSLLTGRTNRMDLPVTQAQLDELADPKRSRLLQDIFPDLTPAQREFIHTGYTPEDWATLFPPEKDDRAR